MTTNTEILYRHGLLTALGETGQNFITKRKKCCKCLR